MVVEVGVLFRTAKGNNCPIVACEVFLDLLPVHIGNVHEKPFCFVATAGIVGRYSCQCPCRSAEPVEGRAFTTDLWLS
jgi:hypothetical protein